MSNDVFSIEINEKYTRVSDLQMDSKQVELISVGFDETVPNFFNSESDEMIQKQVKIMTDLLTNLKIVKKKVNVVIPDSLSYSLITDLPILKEEELLSAIRFQADEFIPLPIDEVYLDIEVLKSDPKVKKQTTLIVASPKKIVDLVYKTLEQATLIPNALENEITAAGRFVSEIMPIKNEAIIIINFGYSTTSLYLIDPQTSLIIMARSFKIGLELLIRDLKVNLNWDEKKIIDALKSIGLYDNGTVNMATMTFPIMKEFIRELQQFATLSQTKHGLVVKRLYTYNLDNHIGNFPQVIQNFLKLPTSTFPFKSVLKENIVSQSFTNDLTAFISVISASLR